MEMRSRTWLLSCALGLLLVGVAAAGAENGPPSGSGWSNLTGVGTGDGWIREFEPVFLEADDIGGIPVDIKPQLGEEGAWVYSYSLYNQGFAPDITHLSVGYPLQTPFVPWTTQTNWETNSWSEGTGSVVYRLESGFAEAEFGIAPGQFSTGYPQAAYYYATAGPPGGLVPVGILNGGHVGSGSTSGPVPEPGSLALLAAGLLGALPFVRKRR